MFFYTDEAGQNILSGFDQKVITIGGDFGYGNFGDVLQHSNTLNIIKKCGRFRTISVMAANAISHKSFVSRAPFTYSTDAVVFVSDYPLILSDHDPQLQLVCEINNVAGVHLYGGGFLNSMWGDYVLSVAEFFLKMASNIPYLVSGQQITNPYEHRVLKHIKEYKPRLFGVRDEHSCHLMEDLGYNPDYSFDDATESLVNLTRTIGLKQGKGLFMHLNSSEYTANQSIQNGMRRQLDAIANYSSSMNGLTVFQAYRDSRQDVIDSTETIKLLDGLFPFNDVRLIDLVGIISAEGKKMQDLVGEFGYSCSYHVALWLQLSGIPCWLRSSNTFYDQKSRALQVTLGLEEFLREPKLADHRFNLERREAFLGKIQVELCSIPDSNNSFVFSYDDDGPAPWPFFYKGKPTFQDKLIDSEKLTEYQRGRAEVAEKNLVHIRTENGELQCRVEALSEQLTSVGDEANRQRERAEIAEKDLVHIRIENGELQCRVEALSEQLTSVGHEANRHRERAEIAERAIDIARAKINVLPRPLLYRSLKLMIGATKFKYYLLYPIASKRRRYRRKLRIILSLIEFIKNNKII